MKPWYRYVAFIDSSIMCEASPLCKSAWGRGRDGIKGWRSPKPLREYLDLLKEVVKLQREGRLEAGFTSLIDRASKSMFSPGKCWASGMGVALPGL